MNRREDTKAVIFLKENIGRKPLDIPLSDIFKKMSPWTRDTKEKLNKWDYIKLKSFLTEKETINKTNR